MLRYLLIFTVFALQFGFSNAQGKQEKSSVKSDKKKNENVALTLATPAQNPFKLLFSSEQDLVDTWGKLHISVTPVDWINQNVPLSEMTTKRTPVAFFPQADGSWEVFSQDYENLTSGAPLKWYERTSRWKLLRGTTTDGVTFSNVETVIPYTDGTWTNHLTMAYNPDAGEYLMLKIRNDTNGHGYYAFFSKDGKQWQEHSGNPLFYEGDAMSLFWSPVVKKFVVVSKSYQPWPTKHIIDHSPDHRRVLMMRSSPDGRNWNPSQSLPPSGPPNYLPGRTSGHPTEWLTTPDANDPPDMEFYSGTAFWYHDRAYMMVLNYAASPMFPRTHGEELDNEWWTSYDGLSWERPARGVNALASFMDGNKRINMGPMNIGGKLLWLNGNRLEGLPEDRISGVSARANGEFSTKPFTMPGKDLLLNAAVPSPDRPWVRRNPQPYVMVEVLNAQGNVIPGFERDKCVIWDETTSPNRNTQVDVTEMQLMWNGVCASKLAGQTISLRFYIGGSTIYAVTAK
jgi:hypothetical protein